MRRFSMFLSTVAVMLLGILGLQMQPVAIAQEATPTTMNRHPLVGTWLLDTDADDPANTPDVVVFTGGGAYISVDAEGFPSLGVWEASGERTATLTIVSPGMEEEAFAGTFMIRATIDVDEVGDAFTAQYTGEFVEPDVEPAPGSTARGRPRPRGSPPRPWGRQLGCSRSCSKGRMLLPPRRRRRNTDTSGSWGLHRRSAWKEGLSMSQRNMIYVIGAIIIIIVVIYFLRS